MRVLLFMSIFWIIYGISGLLGFQHIHSKYKGYSWTKEYIRCQGATWLMLGVPLLVFERIIAYFFADTHISFGVIIVIYLILAMPSLVFTIIYEKKYNALLKWEANNKDNK